LPKPFVVCECAPLGIVGGPIEADFEALQRTTQVAIPPAGGW
jgi:hypothetical protein